VISTALADLSAAASSLRRPRKSATYPAMGLVRSLAPPGARLVVALLALVALLAGRARAEPVADAARLEVLLTTLGRPGAKAERRAAAQQLAELAPRVHVALGAKLQRKRATSAEQRRAVLDAIGAAVPDATGKFSQPKRQLSADLKADDEVDWLAALLDLDPQKAALVAPPSADGEAPAPAEPAFTAAALDEVIVDVALLRALAASAASAAASPIFDAAFAEDTVIYRDECGRYLRKMEPYSIPVLTKQSQGGGDRRRYATYQLERLDRQDPAKALAAATSHESLLIEILDTFRATKHREAVYAVFAYINHDSPPVRAAARKAWLGYVTGKEPPPAPKRKMVLPGGKLAEKETPLWLTYRELAEEKLRKVSEEVLDEPIGENQRVKVEELSRRVFAHYDAIRAKQEAAQWALIKSQAASGDLAGAVARIDQLLAVDPDRSERAEMAAIYLAHGQALQAKSQWHEAAAAFSSAHGLAPQAATAKDALAARDFALGKAMEADGKDGTGLFRRAMVAKPDFEEAAEASLGGERPRWMLYSATIAGILAVALAALGVSRRRRTA
jgi:tetratricopeptide (TPR) repeat protein